MTRIIKKHYEDGQVAGVRYYKDDKLHREDGPAYTWYYKNGQVEREYFYKNGKFIKKSEKRY